MSDYGNVRCNFDYLFKKMFPEKEVRNKKDSVKEFFSSQNYFLDQNFTNHYNSWNEMRELFKTNFKDIKIKNFNKNIEFKGFDFPTAGNGGFNERMEYEHINYLQKEQGQKLKDIVFCIISVYIKDVIVAKQEQLFIKACEELLKTKNLENFIKDLENLNKTKQLF